jgi:hypothetical protein
MAQTNRIAAAVLTAVSLTIPLAAARQTTPPDSQEATQVLSTLPLENPGILEIAARAGPNAIARNIPREIREARAERRRREFEQDKLAFFRQMNSDRKHDLTVMLKDHKRITGRVLAADAYGFTIRARYSKQKSTIRYDEVAYWNQVPTAGEQAFEATLLILIAIPLLPLFFLGTLAGWQC